MKAFRQQNLSNRLTGIQLSTEDLQHAECCWVRHIQAVSFAKELEYLGDHGSQSVPIYVKQFGLFLDDLHIIRC